MVAYIILTVWIPQNYPKRDSEREGWVGLTTTLAGCSVLGVFIALYLSVQDGPFSFVEHVGFGWVVVSVGLLGLWISIQPLAMHEFVQRTTENSDE